MPGDVTKTAATIPLIHGNIGATFAWEAEQKGTQRTLHVGNPYSAPAVFRDPYLWFVANANCHSGPGHLCIRLVRIKDVLSPFNPLLVMDAEVGTQGMYYFFPAIDTDTEGNVTAVSMAPARTTTSDSTLVDFGSRFQHLKVRFC
jgi:hypothetical protein